MPLHRAKDSVVSLFQKELEASRKSSSNNNDDDGSVSTSGTTGRSSLISNLDLIEAKLDLVNNESSAAVSKSGVVDDANKLTVNELKLDGHHHHQKENKKKEEESASSSSSKQQQQQHHHHDSIYWQPVITDWKDYEEILPIKLPKSSKTKKKDKKRKDDICFNLMKFCDPSLQEEDFFDPDDDDDEDDGDNNSDDSSDILHLREDSDMNIEAFENHIHTSMNDNDDDNGTGTGNGNGGIVGIAKRASVNVQLYLGVNKGKRISYRPKHYSHGRRSNGSKFNLHVHFAPYKSQIDIKPLKLLSETEKHDMWWQFDDFEHFKAEITLLVQPSEEDEGACKHWLSAHQQNNNNNDQGNNNSTQQQQQQQNLTKEQKWKKGKTSSQSGWWHKYGDSRRGIERIASGTQAKEILEYYKVAIQHVLDEQDRQFKERHCTKQYWLCGKKHCQNDATDDDLEAIARVYRQYTGWSRDLALAAAASDEDAVKTNFDDSIRKTREFYILKQIYRQGLKVHKYTPQFMIPKNISPKGYLNEEECNQIIDSSKQQQQQQQQQKVKNHDIGNDSSNNDNNKENNNDKKKDNDNNVGGSGRETVTSL